jgi:endonuclease/exonuclease/phosphatase (EEP) superfamily protein YafD
MGWTLASALFVGTFAIAATAVPIVRSRAWWVRIFDFPRLQILILAAVALAALLLTWERAEAWRVAFAALLGAALAYQAFMMFPYTVLARRQVEDARHAGPDNAIGLFFANVLMENRNAQGLFDIIEEEDPDVILVVETDGWWERALEPLVRKYPCVVRQPQSNTYGMLLYSRLELIDPQVKFLVQTDVPSIHTRVKLRGGTPIELRCLHPRPPAPQEAHASTPRDAELIVVGRELRGKDVPAIVFGDLNDVAWSRTNYEFQEISGLLDPRVGRGFYHTFHARYAFLRYPLDHCFHTRHLRLGSFKRLRAFGSDHFPVGIRLSYEPDAVATQEEPRGMPQAHA